MPLDPQRLDAPLQLVFEGECLEGHDPEAVRRAVTAALKLDRARADKLFSGRRVLLKRHVDAVKAHRYIVRFAELGARLHAEPATPRPTGAAPTAARPSRHAGRARRWRPLQWAGLGLGAVAGGLLLGLVLGPGLGALWHELPPTQATSVGAVSAAAGSAAAMQPAPLVIGESTPSAAGAGATDAEIPPEMGPDALREYRQQYLAAPSPKAFALSDGGTHGWHAGGASDNDARARAQLACMAALRPGDDNCRIVDADGVWQE